MQLKNFLVVSALALGACGGSPDSTGTKAAASPAVSTEAVAAEPAAPAAALTRIEDPSTVCMINDQHMGVAQIPVQVDGKTYYGCCQACEAKLKENAEARLASDPVTQRPVDKATAVLAKDSTGKVLYFASEANMQAFAARL